MYCLGRYFTSFAGKRHDFNPGQWAVHPLHIAALLGVLLMYAVFSRTTLADERKDESTARAARLDEVLWQWVDSGRIVGAVVALSINGKTVYQQAVGHADREQGIKVQQDTIFRLASMTKLVTSVAAMRLVEQGNLSFDDAVNDWLPYFVPVMKDGRQARITIRQLMNHTSGLTYSFLGAEDLIYEEQSIAQGFDNVMSRLMRIWPGWRRFLSSMSRVPSGAIPWQPMFSVP